MSGTGFSAFCGLLHLATIYEKPPIRNVQFFTVWQMGKLRLRCLHAYPFKEENQTAASGSLSLCSPCPKLLMSQLQRNAFAKGAPTVIYLKNLNFNAEDNFAPWMQFDRQGITKQGLQHK